MRTRIIGVAVAFAAVLVAMSFGNTRSSADYSFSGESDAPGGKNSSANYSNEAAFGEIAATASSIAYIAKTGFSGQGYRIVGLTLGAMPATLNEGQTRQLNASDVLDDSTFISLVPTSVTWNVLNGPIAAVSTGGLATAAIVYQNTNANVQGARASFSSSLLLSVLNVGNDDFGIYAGDQIDDDWQVQYFGENSPNGLATADPDADGQNNKFEFTAGLIPNNPASRFLLRIEAVAGQPMQRRLIFGPRLTDRAYAPQFRANFLSGTWDPLAGTAQIDNGMERTVTDLNAAGAAKFYRVLISKP